MATIESQEAIVLRTLRYGESDVIAHLFTREAGRRNAIAKGVRKPKSRLGGRLEPFTAVAVMLRQGRGDLAMVQGIELVEAYAGLRESWRLQQVAAAALDMLARVSVEQAANEPAYHLTRNFLRLLAGTADDAARAAALLLAYELKLLHVSGLAPQVASCVRCGADAQLLAWSAADGGVVCTSCREPGDRAIEPHVLAIGAWALRTPLAELARAAELPTVGETQASMRLLAATMCTEHAGFSPREPQLQ